MNRWILAAVLLLSSGAALAADLPATAEPKASPSMTSWKISLVPLIASQALDAQSSYGMRELNPLLASSNGGFETKALSIKLGLTAVAAGVEYLIVRKHPASARLLAKLNWTAGMLTSGFAAHNYAVK